MARFRFGYPNFAMMAGIIVIAAGLETNVVRSTGDPDHADGGNLTAGPTIYLVGEAAYRHVLRIDPGRQRLFVASLMVATVQVGFAHATADQFAACLGVRYGLQAVEHISGPMSSLIASPP